MAIVKRSETAAFDFVAKGNYIVESLPNRIIDVIDLMVADSDLAANSWSGFKVVKSHMRRSEPDGRNDTTPKRAFTDFVKPMSF
jgi:hypothetical protein